MTRVSIKDLPPSPPHRSGWPWTEGSRPLAAAMPDGQPWPRISVVTPSFNQARYLEATLRSVLLQGYPDLEYFVMDGGSTDGSVDIIRKYAPWITRWVSEPDGGQSAAINRGLRLGSGVFAAWINSDDMLQRDALVTHATTFGFQAGVIYVGDCLYVDEENRPLMTHRGHVQDFEDLVRIRTVWRGAPRGHIVQPEVLFPRQMALEVGGLNIHNHLTMDFELWGRLLLAGGTFQYTRIPFGVFRRHGEQKTAQVWSMTQSLTATAAALVEASPLPVETRRRIILDLRAYDRDYWLSTGTLARMGLPQRAVLPIREAHDRLRRRVVKLLRRTTQRHVLTGRNGLKDQR